MKNGIKCLIAGLILAGMATSSSHANITVGFNANGSSFVTDFFGNYLSGDLVEIGTFSVAPTFGSPSLANFVVFGTTLTGTGGDAGAFTGSTTASDVGFAHDQIYMVVFNAPTAGAATDLGIAYVNDSVNPTWKFPATADFPNSTSIDVDQFFASPGTSSALAPGATMVFAHTGHDPAGYSLLMLDVPEPSTWMLVGSGFLGLLAFRRRK